MSEMNETYELKISDAEADRPGIEDRIKLKASTNLKDWTNLPQTMTAKTITAAAEILQCSFKSLGWKPPQSGIR